jgi:PAS domain S-box-containing protein
MILIVPYLEAVNIILAILGNCDRIRGIGKKGGAHVHNREVDHRSIFEHVYTFAPIGIALVAIDNTWMNVNPALCNLLGYDKEELFQFAYHDIIHPDDLYMNHTYMNQVLNGNISSYTQEKRYIHKNDSFIWVSLHVSIVREEVNRTPLYYILHIIDISEKKAAEQKLLDIEQLHVLITENARDIISYSTPDGIMRSCSPSVRDLLGYEPEEVIGQSTLYLYHPDDLKELQSKSLSDNDVFTCRVRHKNGSYVWMETNYKINRDDQGNVLNTVAIGRDITERKRNEDNLAEAQRIALLGSWEWDLRTNAITFSDQLYRIYNLSNKADSHQIHEFRDLVHPSEYQRLRESMDQAMLGQDLNMELRNLQANGSIQFLHIRGVVSFDDQGTPVKMNGTVQDITERKLVELKLQESIQRYTSLKNYNHDAVFSLGLDGNIINANRMAEKLTGYKVTDMIGRNFEDLIGTGNLSRILSQSSNDVSTNNNIDKIHHKDSQVVEVLTTVAPIIINSEVVGYYIIAKDITDQKKLLIAKETAENTDKAKSEFLAIMSHEIRTPMNGVIGMTDLLKESGDLNSEQLEYVEIIRKSGNTLLTIINDILDFSKIESGKTQLHDSPLQIRDCIAETLDILSSKALKKNLEMICDVDADVPDILDGDPERLKQVLMNLVGNSIKFTDSGGVSIKVQKLMHQQGKVQLKFVIKDSGIGIPEERLDHLFEPFSQIDNYLTRQHEGTGLGLAICKRLVELMDGTIWTETSDEIGATFVFTIWFKEDVSEAGRGQSEKEPDKPYTPGSLNILIAEDFEINQMVLTKMIEKQGHTLRVVENGQQVLDALADLSYDIIFMDVQMPVMDGLETTRKIKETLPREKCPVIVAVTANALNGDREKCLEAGMDDYISKPFKKESVYEVIHKFFPPKSRLPGRSEDGLDT